MTRVVEAWSLDSDLSDPGFCLERVFFSQTGYPLCSKTLQPHNFSFASGGQLTVT
jgi:hypothetical protein